MDELMAALRQRCDERGGQAEAARRIGVSRQRVNDWLAGRVKPSGEQVLALLDFLKSRK
jgi:DNA-binding transcriptional regulator YdaS (Cro superfamily)